MSLLVTFGLLKPVETGFVYLNDRNLGRGSREQVTSEGPLCEVPARTETGRVELEAFVPYSDLPALSSPAADLA